MTWGRRDDIGMTRNHVPRDLFLPPNIREPPLHSPACTRCVPDWLNGFSTHYDGDVIAEPDRLNSPLKRCVADQTFLDQCQDRVSARRYLILGIIHDKPFR